MKERSIKIIESRLIPVQQLGNGKMTLIEWVKVMLPRKLEGGKLYRFNNEEMLDLTGFEEVSDRIIIPDELYEQKVVTQAWRNKVVQEVNGNLLGTATQQAENETPESRTKELDDALIKTLKAKHAKALKKGKEKKAAKIAKQLKELGVEL